MGGQITREGGRIEDGGAGGGARGVWGVARWGGGDELRGSWFAMYR